MLKIQNISFAYNEKPVLHDISFSVPKGSHVSVIGASGCGKSTLLRLIYGLLTAEKGQITYKNERLLGPDHHLVPGEDFMKYVAQDFDLMPFLSARANVGKYLSNFYPEQKMQRSTELLDLMGLLPYAGTDVRYLSGGQQQRVALARALANEPEVLLLDEPFSHVDHFRKNSLRRNLFTYLKNKEISCLVASHDIEDALAFADHIIVLEEGHITAQGTPQNLYEDPPGHYVASLFGETNRLPSQLFFPNVLPRDILIYAHELQVTRHGPLEVTVITSFFKGKHWLIEGHFQDMPVFFEHHSALSSQSKVLLDAKKNAVQKRMTIPAE
ncbi:ABC transporter ATP-binding protein [Ascidiimonas aurantiaca]|uniref:ABC transporter ATP-binding protein n=1 Tax=Ascidiimonas aurantiaca TaxID=1685432 RepID=UPI0030EE7323